MKTEIHLRPEARRIFSFEFVLILTVTVLISCGASPAGQGAQPATVAAQIGNDTAARAVAMLGRSRGAARIDALQRLRAEKLSTNDARAAAREVERFIREATGGTDVEVERFYMEAAMTLAVIGDTESVADLEKLKNRQPRAWRSDGEHSFPAFDYRREAENAIHEIQRRVERAKLLEEMRGMRSDTEKIEFLVEEAYFRKHRMDGLYDHRSEAAGVFLFNDYIEAAIPFLNRRISELDIGKREMLLRVYRHYIGVNHTADSYLEQGIRLLEINK